MKNKNKFLVKIKNNLIKNQNMIKMLISLITSQIQLLKKRLQLKGVVVVKEAEEAEEEEETSGKIMDTTTGEEEGTLETMPSILVVVEISGMMVSIQEAEVTIVVIDREAMKTIETALRILILKEISTKNKSTQILLMIQMLIFIERKTMIDKKRKKSSIRMILIMLSLIGK